jgi:SAM-dependent methyltransferase
MESVMINKKYATHNREPFFELAKDYIKDDSRVLDIGAGNGAFAKYFNRNDFYLFDGNPQTVDGLKESFRNVKQGILPLLPYDDSFFDVIHCSHVVEHLDANTLYQSLAEMDRCLKRDGVIVISAPLMWDGFYNDLSHVRPYPPAIFNNYLCSGKNNNRTRQGISGNYHIVKTVYRFKEKKLLNNIHFHSGKFGTYSLIGFLKLLNKLRIKFYDKTGYTIILQKAK